jgi:peroxiredoxin
MLSIGDTIPSARVFDDEPTEVDLAEIAGEGMVLLAFYLYDWTDTCRGQLRGLRDRFAEFQEAGVRIYGISRDSPWSHKKYSEQQWLNFPLLSDWTGEAITAFGVSQTVDGLELTPVRSSFLLRDGVVIGTWRYGDDQMPDAAELLAAVRSA